MLINDKLSHPENAFEPMYSRPLFNVTEERLTQSENVMSSILFNVSGSAMEIIPHRENAFFPIFSTPSGILMEVNAKQFVNAFSPIISIVLGRVKDNKSHHDT